MLTLLSLEVHWKKTLKGYLHNIALFKLLQNKHYYMFHFNQEHMRLNDNVFILIKTVRKAAKDLMFQSESELHNKKLMLICIK